MVNTYGLSCNIATDQMQKLKQYVANGTKVADVMLQHSILRQSRYVAGWPRWIQLVKTYEKPSLDGQCAVLRGGESWVRPGFGLPKFGALLRAGSAAKRCARGKGALSALRRIDRV